MKSSDLPTNWKQHVQDYLDRMEPKYAELSVRDFLNDLRIYFEDGSSIQFRYAFYLVDDRALEVGVFTEHCGYHIFPFCISRLETVNQRGEIIESQKFLTD